MDSGTDGWPRDVGHGNGLDPATQIIDEVQDMFVAMRLGEGPDKVHANHGEDGGRWRDSMKSVPSGVLLLEVLAGIAGPDPFPNIGVLVGPYIQHCHEVICCHDSQVAHVF